MSVASVGEGFYLGRGMISTAFGAPSVMHEERSLVVLLNLRRPAIRRSTHGETVEWVDRITKLSISAIRRIVWQPGS
jgi:hypothetical protein